MSHRADDVGKLFARKGGEIVSEAGPELFMGFPGHFATFGRDLQVYAPSVFGVVPPLDKPPIHKAIYDAGHGGCRNV